MSSTQHRNANSRAAGTKPNGPATPNDGKTRPTVTASRHGLASAGHTPAAVCLKNESRSAFIKLHQALIDEYQPATATQHLIVEEMAVARWRLQRAWVIESALIDDEVDFLAPDFKEKYESVDEGTRSALAIRSLVETSPSLEFIIRCEARLSRQLDRCLRRLRQLQQNPQNQFLPNEPNPKIEHSESKEDPTENELPTETVPAPEPSAGDDAQRPFQDAAESPEVASLSQHIRQAADDPEPRTSPRLPPIA